jgi:hypothetical protein
MKTVLYMLATATLLLGCSEQKTGSPPDKSFSAEGKSVAVYTTAQTAITNFR